MDYISLFYLNGIDYQNLPLIKKVVTAFISNVLLIGIIFYFYKDELKEDFYDFKEIQNLSKIYWYLFNWSIINGLK